MQDRQQQLIIALLLLGTGFVATHLFALKTSLYWYVWWSDMVMHIWGGILIGLVVHIVAGFSHAPLRATYGWFWFIILTIVFGWELFERSTGLYNPQGCFIDTVIDIVMGIVGGLLAFSVLHKR